MIEQAKYMTGIPTSLNQKLRSTLLNCVPFEDNHQLRAIFADQRLSPWRNRLPEANSLEGRIDAIIDLLHNKQSSDTGENALAIFLHVLNQRIDPGDACHEQIRALAIELSDALAHESHQKTEPNPNLATSEGLLSKKNSLAQQDQDVQERGNLITETKTTNVASDLGEAQMEEIVTQIGVTHGKIAVTYLRKLYEQVTVNRLEAISKLHEWFVFIRSIPAPFSNYADHDALWLFIVLEKHFRLIEGENMFEDEPTDSYAAYFFRKKAKDLERPMYQLAKHHQTWSELRPGHPTIQKCADCFSEMTLEIGEVLSFLNRYTSAKEWLPDELLGDELQDDEFPNLVRRLEILFSKELNAHLAMGTLPTTIADELETSFYDLTFFCNCYIAWLHEFAENIEDVSKTYF
ncbi:MAG: hypothetical protein KDE56_11095 [Anaerolineales bacterium]|nr:hypothetical protein [Anaerolineales bacterium]